MIDRASTFSDPEIARLLKTKFIAAAIDRDTGADPREQEFFRKISTGGPRDEVGKPLQGFYLGTPDGKPLGSSYDDKGQDVCTLDYLRKLLKKALNDYQPSKVAVIEPSKSYSPFGIKPPSGGLVLNVTSKILGHYGTADYKESPAYVLQYLKEYQVSIGRDHLWIWKEEHEALARGVLSEGLKRRITRCHLDDTSVGCIAGWELKEIKKMEMALADGRLSGSVLLESADGKRGYEAEILGFIDAKDSKVTRFDVVAKGRYWGNTAETKGAPDGKHPLAIAFTLASGTEDVDKIPPALIHEGFYR